MKIQKLAPLLVNQIAAGEVIERPASVVKELLENALDASASHIVVELCFAGMNEIIVSDNGDGIAALDLPLAIAPHATSKISCQDDLMAIATMGFRGEALASIAAVSRFSIQSRPNCQPHAMELIAEAGEFSLLPCARDKGTTVKVRDLFYNTPVRKRFLSSEKTEFLAIDRLIRCFALSEPEIRLDFYHQGERIFQLPKADTQALRLQRVQKLLGKPFVEAAIPIETNQGGLCVEGWIAQPDYARSQQDRLWTYVNRRMVNDKILNHAIKRAYEGRCPPGRYPACLIYLGIKPDEVDVNVHPTKHELRFHQPRLVHDVLRSLIASVLSSSDTGSQSSTIKRPLVQAADVPLSGKTTHETTDWISLNSDFALLKRGAHSFLLHVKRFYMAYLREQLKQTSLPLIGRPLFVPVSISIETHLPALESRFSLLAQIGITLSWLGERTLLVRSVPVMTPYLNLKAFILSILSGSISSTLQLIEAMLKHQTVDAEVISELEKQAWIAYLTEGSQTLHTTYLKPLSKTHCEVFFDE